MELKLNIYNKKEVEKTYIANDFELSFGTCEDLLELVNIDMFEGGLEALSDETKGMQYLRTIVGGLPLFKNILKEVFDGLTDEELKRCKTSDIFKCVLSIIKYSIAGLASSFTSKN